MLPWLLLVLIPVSVSGQPFIPSSISRTLTAYLEFSGLRLQNKLSPACAKDTGTFIRSLSKSLKVLEKCKENCLEELHEHMFALKQFDASGKIPTGISQWATTSEGSWATCNEVDGEKYGTDYCYLMLVPGKNATCPNFEEDPETSIKLKLGVCVPTSCSSRDITTVFNTLSALPLTACKTFCVKSSDESRGFWFWMFTLFMSAMCSLVLGASFFDCYSVDSRDKRLRFRVLCCFSLVSNFKLICTPRKEIMGVHLKGLDFLRFVSVVWVTVGHSSINYMFSDSMKAVFESRYYFWNHLMLDATYAVETFFMITATLLSFAIFKNSKSSNVVHLKSFWLKVFIRRYYRLMPALMVWIGFTTFYGPFIRGSTMASLFNNQDHQVEKCKSWWWMNLLMIQNYRKPLENCFPVSWYSASDFQFFLLSPLIIVPLIKSQAHGLRTASILSLASILCTFFTFWYHNLPPLHYSTRDTEDFLAHAHQQTYPRIPTFIMGILLGKSLALHNKPMKMLKDKAITCWFLTAAIIFVCFYGRLSAVVTLGEEERGPLSSAAHFTLLRLLWSFAILWVIYACQHNLGHAATSLMSSPVWQPFGRLTYCIYLIHWWMIYVVMNFSDRPLHYTSMMQVIIQVTIALVWSSLFEIPVARLEKLFSND